MSTKEIINSFPAAYRNGQAMVEIAFPGLSKLMETSPVTELAMVGNTKSKIWSNGQMSAVEIPAFENFPSLTLVQQAEGASGKLRSGVFNKDFGLLIQPSGDFTAHLSPNRSLPSLQLDRQGRATQVYADSVPRLSLFPESETNAASLFFNTDLQWRPLGYNKGASLGRYRFERKGNEFELVSSLNSTSWQTERYIDFRAANSTDGTSMFKLSRPRAGGWTSVELYPYFNSLRTDGLAKIDGPYGIILKSDTNNNAQYRSLNEILAMMK